MALSFRRFLKGILLKGETSDPSDNLAGSMWHNSTSGRIKSYVEGAIRTLVSEDQPQTLSNKAIDGDVNSVSDLALTAIKTVLADANKFVSRDSGGSAVASIATPTGAVVGTTDSQTLTNKTIDADSNTISNIENADIKAAAAIDAAKIANGTVSSTEFQFLSNVTSDIQTQINSKATASGFTDNTVIRADGASAIQGSGVTIDDSDNVTIPGDLTVNGTTTTLNTANLAVEDSNITINNGGNDAGAEGAGLTVDRTGTSGSLAYEDALPSKWKAGALGSEIQIANVSSTQTFTNKTLTAPVITTPNIDVITLDEQSSTPTTPSAGDKKFYAKNDGKLYTLNSAGTEVEVGSGSGSGGGQNYILNPDAETNTTGWTAYSDPSNTIPTDGTGGSPSITFARATTSPLRGTGSFSVSRSADSRGQGISYDFTIDSADQARVMSIAFDYSVFSGTYAMNGAGDDTTLTGFRVFIYDVTNSQLIYPSSTLVPASSTPNSLSYKYASTFQTNSNSTSYRLIIHIATASTSAMNMYFDNISVGPQDQTAVGPIVTQFVSETFTGGFSTNTTYAGYTRRNGDQLEGNVKISFSGAPNSTTFTLNMPSGYTIDTAKLPATSSQVGFAAANDGGNVHTGSAYVFVNALKVAGDDGSGDWTQAVPFTFGASDYIEVNFSVPIVGWGSVAVLGQDADTRVVAAKYNVTSGSANLSIAAGSTEIVDADTKIVDTHGAVTTGASWKFTAPVGGQYEVAAMMSLDSVADAKIMDIRVHKNGTLYSALGRSQSGVASDTLGAGGSTIVQMNAGDTVDVRVTNGDSSARNITSTNGYCQISINRLSGPAQVAASESVAARYYNSATSISNILATISWTTKDYDTHNAMSAGVYTIPSPGKYQINAAVAISGTFALNNTSILQIQKNGTAITDSTQYIPAAITNEANHISDIISCVAGDLIRVQYATQGTGPAIVSSNTKNFFSITKVGN